ncbi:MAR-binding filament-like protein 1-1 [Cinnamomum micranthum f. kanehirae]|uniref:MAR-binding filament-like protein 1-1 n=1 Tax=Cinnamomum micranthum f. kanehirae TaxID=337451 RepID=A0A443NX30_9MAGN|nr:MAR-binding filament-like protein 1-1 [Cinnamomum micranthum f. kanehirae]
MGVLLGSFCICKSPFHQSLPPPFLTTSQRRNDKKKIIPMAYFRPENQTDSNFMERRPFLFMGLSALPFLQSRANAVESLVEDKQDKAMAEVGPQNLENIQGVSSLQQQVHQQEAPANPFVGFLNGIGIIGLGVLGALYALSQNKMATLQSAIESMKSKLSAKEVAIATLERNFKRSLQSEQEKIEQIRKMKEEQASLLNQLASANTALTEFQQELHGERKLAGDLKAQMDHLRGIIAQAGEDKKILEALLREKQDVANVLEERLDLLILETKDKEMRIKNLNLSLAGKESECENLISVCNQTKEDLAQANAVIEGLKEEVHRSGEEIELKKSMEEDLNARIKLFLIEKDETIKKIHTLQEEYNELKSFSAQRAASDSEILSNKDCELNQLKEKLETLLNEAKSNQALIVELTRERDSLRTTLERETKTVKNLRGELQITEETLGASRLEAAELSEQLRQSKRSCEELTSEVSKIQTEFSEALVSLNQNLDDVESSSKVLSDELFSVKEALTKTKQELVVVTDELEDVKEARENLKKELLEIYKKAETTDHDLKEERKVVASVNNELEELGKQILKDKDARSNLERDLEDATKSLDEMNRKALLLSKELEISNSKGANLETERNMLYTSLVEQKDAVKEAQENLEDAHNLLTKIGKERESLETRSKRLDEELASAKGEILRLRRVVNLIKSKENEQYQQESRKPEDGATVIVKRSGRRKGAPSSEDSE